VGDHSADWQADAWTVTTVAHIAGGKIAEEWWEADNLGRLLQLGAIPAPARATT